MGEFERTSFGWQIQKTIQQIQEWLESLFDSDLPSSAPLRHWAWPDLLAEILLRGLQVLLAGLLLWVLWQVLSMLIPRLRQLRPVGSRSSSSSTQPRTVEAWMQSARIAQAQGNPRQACRCLYLALLCYLGEHQGLPDQPSRTDGEYLRLLSTGGAEPAPAYQLLIQTHERLCFDRSTPISSDTADRCFQALAQILSPSSPS